MYIQKTKNILLLLLSIGLGFVSSAFLNMSSIPAAIGTAPAPIPVANTSFLTTASVSHISGPSPFLNLQASQSAFPTMPKVPGLPQMPDTPGMSKNTLPKLVGLLPPDYVIVTKGNKTITLPCNSSTEFGYIGSITGQGVYIDGTLVSLAEEAKNKIKR